MTTLREALEEAADDLGLDCALDADGTTSWAIDGRPFAALDANGRTATFRLDPTLAAAARRTPDTTSSPRGTEWVAFEPVVVDDHALDRAVAWFAAAARRAVA